jgi:hypothetical protein
VGLVFGGVVGVVAGKVMGSFPKPTNTQPSTALKQSMLGLAENAQFQARANFWTRITGRKPIDWQAFFKKLQKADYREAEKIDCIGWAGLDDTGEELMFAIQKGASNQTKMHELFHGLQEFTEEGLMQASLSKEIGPFTAAAIETSAHIYGSGTSGLIDTTTLIGIAASGFSSFIGYVTASSALDMFEALGFFE